MVIGIGSVEPTHGCTSVSRCVWFPPTSGRGREMNSFKVSKAAERSAKLCLYMCYTSFLVHPVPLWSTISISAGRRHGHRLGRRRQRVEIAEPEPGDPLEIKHA